MEKKSTLSTKKIAFTALMAALVVIGSALRVQLPISVGGTTAFHLGNIFCALSGLLLGPWLGAAAAGVGSALFDIMSNYADEFLITFLTKGAYGLVVGLIAWTGTKEYNFGKALLSTTAGAITYAILYLTKSYFYSGLLKQGLTPSAAIFAVAAKIPATLFNAVVAIIIAPILAIAIREGLKRAHIEL